MTQQHSNLLTNSLLGLNGSIQEIIDASRKAPILDAETEMSLLKSLHQNNSKIAKDQLVISHLRYVAAMANKLSGYKLPQEDLIKEGIIGLLKAIDRFDVTSENRLCTFAVHWIKAEMNEYVIRNVDIVKIATTKNQRKLFFNLRKMKTDTSTNHLSSRDAEAIADKLDIPVDEVRAMDMRLCAHNASFEGFQENNDNGMPLSDAAYFLTNTDDDVEHIILEKQQTQKQTEALATMIEGLDERNKDIIKSRWLNEEKATLTELADKYGVSAERIRQLEANCFRKIRQEMPLAA